jgi:hypothetical protein
MKSPLDIQISDWFRDNTCALVGFTAPPVSPFAKPLVANTFFDLKLKSFQHNFNIRFI